MARESGGETSSSDDNKASSVQAKAPGVLSNDVNPSLFWSDAVPLASDAAQTQVTAVTIHATEPKMAMFKAE